jgi:hypothetical protein
MLISGAFCSTPLSCQGTGFHPCEHTGWALLEGLCGTDAAILLCLRCDNPQSVQQYDRDDNRSHKLEQHVNHAQQALVM